MTVIFRRAPPARGGGAETRNGSRDSSRLPENSSLKRSTSSYSPGLASSSEKPIIRETAPSGVGRMRLGASRVRIVPSLRRTS